MKSILFFLAAILVLLAFVYQVTLVTPGYDKEARYQYDDVMHVLRLYGRSLRTEAGADSVIYILGDAQRIMNGMRPPLRRASWHFLFVRALGRCRREVESADVVGSPAAGDDAVRACADGLLPLGG